MIKKNSPHKVHSCQDYNQYSHQDFSPGLCTCLYC